MDLILDTASTKFQVSGAFEPRLDKDGVHRRDKSGGTNLPLYAVKLVAWTDADAETILVTVAIADRVAFRAKSVVPHSNGAPAPKPAN
jgi:hypothetical protein